MRVSDGSVERPLADRLKYLAIDDYTVILAPVDEDDDPLAPINPGGGPVERYEP